MCVNYNLKIFVCEVYIERMAEVLKEVNLKAVLKHKIFKFPDVACLLANP